MLNAWPTALFVLLWSSGAIFSRWGLDHASPFVLLTLRFGVALAVLCLLGWRSRHGLPEPGTRWQVAATGLLLVGGYSCAYFLALDHGLTPGALATILGVQPIVTLLFQERKAPALRWLGLALALAGLVLVVLDSLLHARVSVAGVGWALAALGCITLGTMAQKRIAQPPTRVLPLQCAVALVLCLALLPTQPLRLDAHPMLAVSVLWLGAVISVGATVLLYRLLRAGNLVNVTSLFYLVPGGTALLDWWLLGNRMAPLAMMGLGLVVAGLVLVFRARPAA
ncbi:DMT family transporter [Ottowia sp. SB7-C50]|uniref:DMT family transporter n=1 Tax=Ottowia sp. SB7-C50 TaxID=3081231 RepID=UPI00295333C0|nr:DMT family transporter [Ottowia sp. SB7-C50]WOP15237.1 DMT family transporter [Ottowia sp. SB7-C50]